METHGLQPASGTERATSRRADTGSTGRRQAQASTKLPRSRKRVRNSGSLTRGCVSSIASMSIATSGPRISRLAQSAAMPKMAANEFDAIIASAPAYCQHSPKTTAASHPGSGCEDSTRSAAALAQCTATSRRFRQLDKTPRLNTRRGAMNHVCAGMIVLVPAIRGRADSRPRTCPSFD
jgi:hypothetical protein